MTSVQSDTVTLLDAARQSPPVGGWPGNQLAPVAVRPYLAELQDAKALLKTLPAVYVELSTGVFTPMGDRGTIRSAHVVTLVLACRNAAGREAAAHDGARLLEWCVAVLRSAGLRIGAARVEAINYQRILSDRELWSARVDLALGAAIGTA